MALVSNKTIAKNSVYLFVRTLITVIISLYTSRIVLQVLGVSDYGIYSVVGSVVATVSILNTLLSIAVSRFLTFEIGNGNKQKLHQTYCSAVIGQVALAILIVILLETVGLYLLNSKLVIDADRMQAARIVFHLSVIASFFTIIQDVFIASITAHEDFTVYAYMDILSSVLKLGIVFILMVGNFDRLILYSILILVSNIIIFFIYRIYCKRRYEECQFEWLPNKEILLRMLRYSGWSMFVNVSKTVNIQGGNMILNVFFGTVVNAANGIAMTVQGVLVSFTYNIITAFRSQIIKSFAVKEYEHMSALIYRCGKYATALFLVVAIPFFIEMEYVLQLWLGLIPEYTTSFLRILIIGTVLYLNCSILGISVGASERVAQMNVTNGSLYLFQLALIYFLFKHGYSPSYLYVALVPVYCIILISNSINLKKINPLFNIMTFFKNSLLDNSLPVIITVFCGFLLLRVWHSCFLRLFVICTISIMIFGLYYYFIVFNKSQRVEFKGKVFSVLHINNSNS